MQSMHVPISNLIILAFPAHFVCYYFLLLTAFTQLAVFLRITLGSARFSKESFGIIKATKSPSSLLYIFQYMSLLAHLLSYSHIASSSLMIFIFSVHLSHQSTAAASHRWVCCWAHYGKRCWSIAGSDFVKLMVSAISGAGTLSSNSVAAWCFAANAGCHVDSQWRRLNTDL